MTTATPVSRIALRACLAFAWIALAGCMSLREIAPVEPVVPPVEARSEPGIASAPTGIPRPAPRPLAPPLRNVVVLFEEGAAGYTDVAEQIAKRLPSTTYRTTLVPFREAETPEVLARVNALRPSAAVGIGREAAAFARRHLDGTPLVFCQVFNYQEVLAADRRVWGVSPTPPLALQLRAWTAVDPSRRRIGLIVSERHTALVDEAIAAAGDAAEIKHDVSASDRETLYLFKRLAADVDGFWLVPDNSILSPTVLRELLSYAARRRIGVLVFNDSLLSWGALMSATSTSVDIARSVHSVLDRVTTGETKGLPALTPLGEVEIEVNAEVASRLGVKSVPPGRWVLRDAD